ncbi:MAG: hypothetical protein ACREIV_00080, partial [Planctomycetaceae bacterium]
MPILTHAADAAGATLPAAGAEMPVAPAELLRKIKPTDTHRTSKTATWYPRGHLLQKRQEHRVPFTRTLLLTWLCDTSGRPNSEPQRIIGRDVSVSGVSFTHRLAIPCRRVALTFPLPDGSVESFVVRLTWCCFTRAKVYQSGGPFGGRIELPGIHGLD